ncbi:hypothetical protein ABZ904_19620 [Streptomyces sp. NPDC046900]|uniref:hypothetical protein n=1 Tax=Streptomyces sp. NPDC046900 TaxID=3155473 RepID=UPI00340DF121
MIPLVEVAPGERTGEDAVQAAVDFWSSVGRTHVDERKEIPGFLGTAPGRTDPRPTVDEPRAAATAREARGEGSGPCMCAVLAEERDRKQLAVLFALNSTAKHARTKEN